MFIHELQKIILLIVWIIKTSRVYRKLKLGKKIKISSNLNFKLFLFYSTGKSKQKKRPKQNNDSSTKTILKVCVFFNILSIL